MDFSDIYRSLDGANTTDELRTFFTEGFKRLLDTIDGKDVEAMVTKNLYVLLKFYHEESHQFFAHGVIARYLINYVKVNSDVELLKNNEWVFKTIYAYGGDDLHREQLKDTCEESDRVLIIYNKNFWEALKKEDRDYIEPNDAGYLIRVSAWVGRLYDDWQDGKELRENTRINHAILSLLEKEFKSPDGSDRQRYNFSLILNYIFYFSDIVGRLYEKKITEDEFVKEVQKALETFSITKSGNVNSADMVEHFLKLSDEPDVCVERLGF